MKVKKGTIVKEAKDGQVQKLKNRIKNLEKKNKILVQKLNTAEKALEESAQYLRDHTEDISVEELIKAAKDKKTLKEVEDGRACPNCGSKAYKSMPTLFGELKICQLCKHKETVVKND